MFEKQCTDLIDGFRKMGLRIATAESCTGGMLSVALTQIAGSSDVFERGFVTYSYPSKTELLGVSKDSLDKFGAVSRDVALEMAIGAIKHSNADVALSITGVAGPGSSEKKPEGLVFFGLATRDGSQEVVEKQFGALGRSNVRMASLEEALNMLATKI